MMDEALFAWRTREGTALAVTYGALVAVVSGIFAYAPETARAYAGTPLWLRLLPVGAPLAVIAALGAVQPLRAHAYRLQLVSIGSFLFALVTIVLNEHNGAWWLLTVVICMFGVQNAFMRWQELVAAYGGSVAFFAACSFFERTGFQPRALSELQALSLVASVCVVLGSVRLRSMYLAANERSKLELQTAELRRQTERNARLALTDHLTGLLNRTGMNDLIDRALALSARNGFRTALLYVDLDGFKRINDTLGHDAGDLVLVEAALRIQYVLRAGETVGRIGGDEFVILLPAVQSLDAPRALGKRVEEVLAEPFHAEGREFRLSASIGAAESDEHGQTRSELLSAADKSMYVIKRCRKFEHSA